jgi:hypothetical protein
MPWHHGTPGPTVRAEPAKETGPNGQAVGPGIHAEAGMNALGRSRTFNLQIKSLLLCQLSYECKMTFAKAYVPFVTEAPNASCAPSRHTRVPATPNIDKWRARRDSNPRPTA